MLHFFSNFALRLNKALATKEDGGRKGTAAADEETSTKETRRPDLPLAVFRSTNAHFGSNLCGDSDSTGQITLENIEHMKTSTKKKVTSDEAETLTAEASWTRRTTFFSWRNENLMREDGKLMHDGLSRITTGVKDTSHAKEICNFEREKREKLEEEESPLLTQERARAPSRARRRRQNIRVLLLSGRFSRCAVASSRF